MCIWFIRLQDCIANSSTNGLSLFIRAGNHWWVSNQLGKKGGHMRAEVGEADQRLPPVKGWEAYKPGKLMFWKGKWSLKDQTLECSCDPSAESAGQVVC